MVNLIKQKEDLVTFVKSVIFKYCPYVDDRLSICCKSNSPEIDIEIYIDKESQIIFLFGNSNFKSMIPEKIIIPSIIEFEEIEKIIDFILKDHEYIKNVNLDNSVFGLNFAINWTEQSIKGINCGDIKLNLNFNNIELEKQYLYLLFQKYYAILEHTPSFNKIKNEYINSAKKSYINSLDKKQLITLLNNMNENELRELLYNLDNDIFIKHTTGSEQQPKIKKLFLEKSNKVN